MLGAFLEMTTSHPVEGSEINIDEETRWSGNTDYTCSCVICGVPVFVASGLFV